MARDDEVLRRRARFVATALALAGCSRDKSLAGPVPAGESKGTTSASVLPTPAPTLVAPPKDRPPLSAAVTPAGKAALTAMVEAIEAVHTKIAKAAGAVPGKCDLEEPACRSVVRAYVLLLADLAEEVPRHPPCPPKAPDDIAIEAVREAHAAWLRRWLASIQARLDADHGKSNPLLTGLRHEAEEAHPQVCLKYACP